MSETNQKKSAKDKRYARAEQRFHNIENEIKESNVCHMLWENKSLLLECKLRDAGYQLTEYTEECTHECQKLSNETYPLCYKKAIITIRWEDGSFVEKCFEYR